MGKDADRITVAVIDDHESILDAIRLVFEEQQWRVLTYPSGEAFLADFASRRCPDCVILDPHLSGINGSEVARSIAARDGQVPVIGLTAHPNSPITAAVCAAGIFALLTKPVTSQQLVEHVLAAIGCY